MIYMWRCSIIKWQIQAKISEAISKFEIEHMGRSSQKNPNNYTLRVDKCWDEGVFR